MYVILTVCVDSLFNKVHDEIFMKRDQSDDFIDLKVLNHQVILNSAYFI